MKSKIGYKVVDTVLASAIIGSLEFCVNYKLNEWVFPKVKEAPLMVFDNFYDAKKFCTSETYGHLSIYKCEYKQSKKMWGCCIGRISEVLRLKKQKKRVANLLSQAPDGTVFADAVKLIERMAYEDFNWI